jgi:transposase-like protein
MAERRRYTKREKATAVAAAVASSTLAAAEQSGVPESTLRYWMNDPEFAEIREKARAELAPLAATAAFYAWVEAIRLLREHKLDPHDVIFLAGLSVDKSQLLSGAATMRTETRALSDSLDDHARPHRRSGC